MGIRSKFTLAVVAVTMIAAITAGGAVAPAATAATSPVEQAAAQTFCADVNHERAARGLQALRCTYNGAAQSAVESHQDRTAVWIPLAPNPAYATIAFMQSPPHRWWIMDPTATIMDVGVSCSSYQVGDGSTDFGMYVGADLPDAHGPDGAPPAGYVTQADSSTPCGARIPPSTNPPPATVPPQPASTASQAPSPGPSNGSGPGSQPAASGSTAGPGEASRHAGSPSTTIPGYHNGSAAGPGAPVTSTSVASHETVLAKGRHGQGGRSAGAPHGSITSPRSSSPSGHLNWWWALVPVCGLGLVVLLLVARRIHLRPT